MSSISTLLQPEGVNHLDMDFDDCEMDAGTIFFNSPGGHGASESLTSGYQSFEEESTVLAGNNISLHGVEEVDMEMDVKPYDTDQEFELYKPIGLRRSLSLDMRKRMMENNEVSSPTCFRQPTKSVHKIIKERIEEVSEGEIQVEEQRIKSAVERLADSELIADCSRPYSLPTVCGKHKDLKSITPQTVTNLLNGVYGQNSSMILDCRYPYEYKGGHIKGALNAYTKDSIDTLLKRAEINRPQILIFHCEFSSHRAPTLLRHLRSQDRLLNSHNYPALYYPEIYILDGGYKAFYEYNKSVCQPQRYTPMLHEDHSADLRHFRVKSKSWSAGEKPREKKTNRPRTIRF